METVSAFIPIDRRHAIVRRQVLPDRTAGAVLFADLSGFTHLTDILAHEMGAQRGAEEISLQLDRIFGVMIACVHDYAGSVISFSGDAVTCWFDDAPIGASVSHNGAMRAAMSAFAIQEAIRALRGVRTPLGTAIAVGVKVAVAAGVTRRFLLGHPAEQRIEVLAGYLVDRTAAAEKLLQPGEIALGPEVVALFGPAVAIREWREASGDERFAIVSNVTAPLIPSPWQSFPTIEPQIAQGWVLKPVYSRIQSVQGQFLAELRPVVTMFLSFAGINYERDEDAGQKLYDYASWVQATLRHYEGYLLQFIIGDKGSYCYMVFGALQAHENDATRAIAAATVLHRPPPEVAFVKDIRIGISSGTLHVGAYGSPARRTFGVVGNESNVAARLMSAANPAQILVTPRLASRAAPTFDYEDLGTLALKGLARPVSVLSLVGSRRPPGRLLHTASPAHVVGREGESAYLIQKLRQLQNGGSSTILIEGEAGIGKSHLLSGFLEEARRAGVFTLFGAGDAIEQATPYFAWRPIFRSLLAIDDGDVSAMVRQKVADRLPEDESLTSLLPLLNPLLPLQLPDNALTAQMTGEARATATRTLLLKILSRLALSGGPLLVAFDDAHWLDSASAALLAQVRRVLSPVMTLIMTRPGSESAAAQTEYRRLLEAPDVERVTLGSLSRQQVDQLICQQLGVSELPPDVGSFIFGHSEGHPFFSAEIAFALRDAGYIRVEDGRCFTSNGYRDLHSLDFPATIQGVITSRIDRLDNAQQLTLKVASVLGRIFLVRILRNIYPARNDVEQLPAQLTTLEQLDIILRETPPPDLSYIFKHHITQEVIYNLMTFSQRQQLHRSAALWYEQRHGDDLAPNYPLLAHHWSRAEDHERAIHYLDKAGDEALRNFANEEAIDFFSQALQADAAAGFPTPRQRRAMWELKIGEAYVHWTRYGDGCAHIERGLALLDMPMPYQGSLLHDLRHALAAIIRQAAHRLWPRRYLASQRVNSPTLLAASRAYSRLVEAYFHGGETLRSTHAAFHTLNLAELAGDSPELAEAYAPIGAFFSFLRFHRLANAYFQRALSVAAHVNSLPARSFVLLAKATYETGIGQWSRARASIDELIDSGQRLGAQRRYNDGLQLLSILHYAQADYAGCLEVGQKLLASARQLNDLRFQGYGLYACAFGNFHLGAPRVAVEQLQELESLFTQKNAITDLQLALISAGLWCLIHLSQNNLPLALQSAGQAEELAEGPFQVSYWTLPGYCGPAEVYLTLWELGYEAPDLPRQAHRAIRALKRYARTFPIGRPAALLYQGWRQNLGHNPRTAARTWQKGLQEAGALQLPYEAARISFELARIARPSPPGQGPALQQAYDQLQALESTPGLRAVTHAASAPGSEPPPFFTSAARG